MTTKYPLGKGQLLEIREGEPYSVLVDEHLIAQPPRERIARGMTVQLPDQSFLYLELTSRFEQMPVEVRHDGALVAQPGAALTRQAIHGAIGIVLLSLLAISRIFHPEVLVYPILAGVFSLIRGAWRTSTTS
jgi:hypothetical protein